jgi:RND family efflux transporter MFP subunit
MVDPKKSKTGKLIWALRIVLVLFVALAAAGILIKTRPKPQRQMVKSTAPLVEVAKLRKTSRNMIIQTYGTVRSGENLNLTAEVHGKIVEMAPDFEEGAYFTKESFLMRIDPRNFSLAMERLQTEIKRLNAELDKIAQEEKNFKASLKIALDELRLSKADYDRNLSLSKRKVVSQTALDHSRQKWLASRSSAQEIENSVALIKPRIALLKAQRQSAVVQLKEAQLDFERTEIRAPFDCVVGEKLVETGQYITAGTRLAGIYNVGILEVEVRIPPQDIVWLHFKSGDTVDLKGNPPANARIILNAAGRQLSWNGFVSRIKRQMEERTRTLPVVVEVQNGHPTRRHPLLPGMFVNVEIVGKKVDDMFTLPQEAIREDSSVYIVDESKVKIRKVKVLRRIGNQVYVKEGLSDGDQVIIRFPGVASEGMKVRVKPKADEERSSG